MLTRFAVTNYRGFDKRIELDLATPKDYQFNTYAIKNGIIKNAIIYGPNGCGKTNLSFAIFDIVNHLSQKWKKATYYDNFVYTGSSVREVSFEYTFMFDRDLIQYDYTKNDKGVLIRESLQVNGKSVFEKDDSLTLDTTQFKMDDSAKEAIERSSNAVSIVNYLLTSFPLQKNHYLIKLRDFVASMLWFRCLEQREFIGLETAVYYLNDYIISNKLVQEFADFLEEVSDQHFDFNLTSDDDKMLLCNINGNAVPFDGIASTGTHALMLLFFWIHHLKDASFVFIDEFDAFYHFKTSYEVCKLLFSYDCQVLLSSHTTYLMTNDLLRPDCNFVMNENTVKPLSGSTEKELRYGHNIEKLYRGGTFDD